MISTLLPTTGVVVEGLLKALGPAAYASAAFGALFMAGAVLAARRFARGGSRAPEPASLPPVTILKPLKGTDHEMYENLASFLSQDYPKTQVLFCLQNQEDPSLPVLRRLREDFPRADVDIVISKNRIGYNPKVNNLSNAYGFAKHDLIVISDSDVRVDPGFLRRAVAPFDDPAVGLVTCFYRSAGASGLCSTLDALSVNAQFLPQALTAGILGGMRFAMGAVMIVRRQAFESAGGLHALSQHLADDFVLGRSVAAAGWKVEFSPTAVVSMADRCTPAEQFAHQIRWARTIRVCNPLGYAGTILLHGPALLLLHALFGGGLRALGAFAALEAWRAAALYWMHRRCLGSPEIGRQLALLPASDLLQFAAWVGGWSSRSVLWRGETYSIAAGGRLVPRRVKPEADPLQAPV